MATSPYDEALRCVRSLSAAEQKRLLAELNAPSESTGPHTSSILELEGLGKEVWAESDTDEYLERERRSWDR